MRQGVEPTLPAPRYIAPLTAHALSTSPFPAPPPPCSKVLLEILDRLQPGCVNWKAVSKPSNMKSQGLYSRLENCQLAVKIATQALRINLVGIGGADIANGNRMLILCEWC